MKDARNEREASRLMQDSGFGRVRDGKLVDWATPPHRAAACFEPEPVTNPWVVRAIGVLVVIAAGVGGALMGWF